MLTVHFVFKLEDLEICGGRAHKECRVEELPSVSGPPRRRKSSPSQAAVTIAVIIS